MGKLHGSAIVSVPAVDVDPPFVADYLGARIYRLDDSHRSALELVHRPADVRVLEVAMRTYSAYTALTLIPVNQSIKSRSWIPSPIRGEILFNTSARAVSKPGDRRS